MKKKKTNKYANIGGNQQKQEAHFYGRSEGKWNTASQLMLVMLVFALPVLIKFFTKMEEARVRFQSIQSNQYFLAMVVISLLCMLLIMWLLPIRQVNHSHMGKVGELRDELMIDGGFKYTRNPFYFLQSLVLPFINTTYFAVGWLSFSMAITALYSFFMYKTIRAEEKRLEAKYGQKYLDYKRITPRFWPRDWLGFLREARFPKKQTSEPAQRV